MSKPIISVCNISKVYRLGEIGATSLREETAKALSRLRGQKESEDKSDFWALKDVSFDVKPGEVVGIIGKNGAGKSTLLKVISRITEPSGGEIRLRGRVAALLEVGTGFHPELTGRENIYLNGTILGMRKREIDERLDEIIDFSGIEKHIDTPVKRYSSGMNVRLGFAVAAHLEPEILIVDEVLAVGDADFQKKCIDKMQNVSSKGRTVLFVSHNMASISRLTKRCIVIDKGGIVFDGTTPDAVDIYFCKGEQIDNTNFDASKLPRLPFGSGAATISMLEQPNQSKPIRIGDNIEIPLTVKASDRIEKLQFQITIFEPNGQAIGTTSSKTYLSLSSNEERSLTLCLSNHCLAPGKYYCDIALITGDPFEQKLHHEVIPRALLLEIASTVGKDNRVAIWNKAWGNTILENLKFKEKLTTQQNIVTLNSIQTNQI